MAVRSIAICIALALVALLSVLVRPVPAQDSENIIERFEQAIRGLHRLGRSDDAVSAGRQFVAAVQNKIGNKNPEFAYINVRLGRLYRDLRLYSEAELLFKQALAIGEEVQGTNHADVHRTRRDLRDLYLLQRRYREAETIERQILAGKERLLGPDHPDVADSLVSVGVLLVVQRRTADAKPLFERALDIRKRVLAPNHPKIANALHVLGQLFVTENRLREAELFLKSALAIYEEVSSSPDDEQLATPLSDVAIVYTRLYRFSEAEAHFARAISIMEKHLGGDRSSVGSTVYQLGHMYNMQHRLPEAEAQYRRTLTIWEKVHGPSDTDVANAAADLAQVYSDHNRDTEAEPLLDRAIAILENAIRSNPPDLAVLLARVGNLYSRRGQFREASRAYERAIAIDERELGANHPAVATLWGALAVLHYKQGNSVEAERFLKEAIRISEAVTPGDPNLSTYLMNLGALHEERFSLADADQLYTRALSIREEMFGPAHVEVAVVREALGGLRKAQGRGKEAETLLRSAQEIMEGTLGTRHPSIANVLTQLGDLYRRQNRCNEADPLFLRARSIGARSLVEVPVLFATNRKREQKQQSVSFSGDRGSELSFGLVVVTVPKERAAQKGSRSATNAPSTDVGVADTQRLAMHCIEVIDNAQIVEAAVRRLGNSKTYPSEVLIFVHGFNVSFDGAVRRVAQIAHDIKFDGGTFLFSWPSRETVKDYFTDRETVDIAAEDFQIFLEKIVAKTNARKVHFIAHSMGNMVLLRALRNMGNEAPALREVIGEIIYAAPDVDPGVFARLVEKVRFPGAGFTLYASRGDKPLWLSGLLRDRPRAGYILDKPLILENVDTVDITSAGSAGWYNLFALDHDIYASSPPIVLDMQRIIQHRLRPPDKRSNDFEPVVIESRTYWRLRGAQPPARQ